MNDRRDAAIHFLSFISNHDPNLYRSSTENEVNPFTISPSPSPSHDLALSLLQASTSVPLKEKNKQDQNDGIQESFGMAKTSSNSLLHLKLQQQSSNAAFKKESHANSSREQAALQFLGHISSRYYLLGYTIPSSVDIENMHASLVNNTEGNHILSAHMMQSPNLVVPADGSAIDVMATSQTANTIPLAIPANSISNYKSNHARNAIDNSSISYSSGMPMTTLPRNNSKSPDGDTAMSVLGHSSSIILADSPGVYTENNSVSNQVLRNSIYRSPGIPRKSLNMLSNKSARSSESSLLDPLYAFTFAGGPVTLFSMMPLMKHEQKKSRNTTGSAIASVSGVRASGKRSTNITSSIGPTSAPYYHSFSPYLEKMGLTTISFDVKLQRKKIAESFASLLDAQGLLEQTPTPELTTYDPYYLDHPDLRSGKNKTVITLPCFLGTIIQPSTAREIKKELNQHFKEAHPGLDSTITLSQIRSIKLSLCKIGVARDLEPSSVAFAHVYLEKLILKNFLNKINKKLIAACCLLLAIKVNDSKDINYSLLVESMEKELEVPRKDIYASEFHVYTELEFGLFLPFWEVGPHLNRVESLMDEVKNAT